MSTVVDEEPDQAPGREQRPRKAAKPVQQRGDRIFAGSTKAAGILILLVLAGVAAFLLGEGYPALTAGPGELPQGENFLDYVWPLVFGTLLSATIALVIATPFAVCVALFISHYAPRKLSRTLGYVVDLLAAVPSIVYGLWGIFVLAPASVPAMAWLERNLGFLPFFTGPVSTTGRTIFVASLVLAIMVLPVITAVAREIFLQTPRLHQEAALALGATRWEMIRMAVLPFGRPGVISGAMLGLGRALGETMAIAIVLSASGIVTFNLIGSGNPTPIAANIALQFPESTGLAVNALIASGLVLFAVTMAVNMAARYIIERRKAFSGAN